MPAVFYQFGERLMTATYFRFLSREFDARIKRNRRKAPPSPKTFQPLGWRFHTLYPLDDFHITVREISGRAHQNGGEGKTRHWFEPEADGEQQQPMVYRQLVQNGKPVPLTEQLRKVDTPAPKVRFGARAIEPKRGAYGGQGLH